MTLTRILLVLLLLTSLLTSCAGPPPAPSRDRDAGSDNQKTTPDGYYRIRRGDSLHAIAFKFGLDWREIARINGISSPYIIYPDQLLRLGPSAQQPATVAKSAESKENSSTVQTRAAPPPSKTITRSLETPSSSTNTSEQPAGQAPVETNAVPSPKVGSSGAVVSGTQAPAGASYAMQAGDPDRWLWPTDGRLISSFKANDPTRKGIDIGGTAGQVVVASATGQVVYSGSGLIGYGELIIIKHSDRMLSAYAHNKKRMVTEGQQVIAGSQIAEMGTNDRNQAVLHYEIRVNGSPEDPLKFLPKR